MCWIYTRLQPQINLNSYESVAALQFTVFTRLMYPLFLQRSVLQFGWTVHYEKKKVPPYFFVSAKISYIRLLLRASPPVHPCIVNKSMRSVVFVLPVFSIICFERCLLYHGTIRRLLDSWQHCPGVVEQSQHAEHRPRRSNAIFLLEVKKTRRTVMSVQCELQVLTVAREKSGIFALDLEFTKSLGGGPKLLLPPQHFCADVYL